MQIAYKFGKWRQSGEIFWFCQINQSQKEIIAMWTIIRSQIILNCKSLNLKRNVYQNPQGPPNKH